MRRVALGLALSLAVFAAPAGVAHAADCWLLDGAALEQAQQRGQCQDAFARNPPKPTAAPKSARKAKAARRVGTAPGKRSDSLDRLIAAFTTKPLTTTKASRQRPGDHLAYGATGPRTQR